MKKLNLVSITVTALLLMISCVARRSEPIREKYFNITNEQVLRGQQVFMYRCQKCHPGGEAGLGPALNSNPAPGFIKRLQVRVGLGVMPGFNVHQVSRQEAKDLSKYMKALRRF